MTTIQTTRIPNHRIPNHRIPPSPEQVEPQASPEADGTAQTIAHPAPLGLAGFPLPTFCLSVFKAQFIVRAALRAVVLPLALFYGGMAQFLAGMWEFRKGDTFEATAFTSFDAFWNSATSRR